MLFLSSFVFYSITTFKLHANLFVCFFFKSVSLLIFSVGMFRKYVLAGRNQNVCTIICDKLKCCVNNVVMRTK